MVYKWFATMKTVHLDIDKDAWKRLVKIGQIESLRACTDLDTLVAAMSRLWPHGGNMLLVQPDEAKGTVDLLGGDDIILIAEIVEASWSESNHEHCRIEYDGVPVEVHSRDSDPDCRRWTAETPGGECYAACCLMRAEAAQVALSVLVSRKPISCFR